MSNEIITNELYSEKPVQIVVNGRAAITLMTHTEKMTDLVIGALFTERVIAGVDDVESIVSDETQVSVVTKDPYTILLSRKTVLAGCGGASSFLDSGKLGEVSEKKPVTAEAIALARAKVPDSAWFSGGLFSADGKMISLAEDISSQNVLDILIGEALSSAVDFSETFVVLKGNCVVETMRKAVIAKIPVMVVNGALTMAAKNTADASGLRVELI